MEARNYSNNDNGRYFYMHCYNADDRIGSWVIDVDHGGIKKKGYKKVYTGMTQEQAKQKFEQIHRRRMAHGYSEVLL